MPKTYKNIIKQVYNLNNLSLAYKTLKNCKGKEKFECDFLIKEGVKIKKAIQVCYDLSKKNIDREINGLMEKT